MVSLNAKPTPRPDKIGTEHVEANPNILQASETISWQQLSCLDAANPPTCSYLVMQ
jgi:hypothetical protein